LDAAIRKAVGLLPKRQRGTRVFAGPRRHLDLLPLADLAEIESEIGLEKEKPRGERGHDPMRQTTGSSHG
jgi:hypothetical protein